VVGVLRGFEPFPHGSHHIRVNMHHVCLIQSISARKATHIELGTCSGSSQCQLQSGTQMMSIKLNGCGWLPSECNNAHFQAFSLLAASANFHANPTLMCKLSCKHHTIMQTLIRTPHSRADSLVTQSTRQVDSPSS
jgi:hypothetical protein